MPELATACDSPAATAGPPMGRPLRLRRNAVLLSVAAARARRLEPWGPGARPREAAWRAASAAHRGTESQVSCAVTGGVGKTSPWGVPISTGGWTGAVGGGYGLRLARMWLPSSRLYCLVVAGRIQPSHDIASQPPAYAMQHENTLARRRGANAMPREASPRHHVRHRSMTNTRPGPSASGGAPNRRSGAARANASRCTQLHGARHGKGGRRSLKKHPPTSSKRLHSTEASADRHSTAASLARLRPKVAVSSPGCGTQSDTSSKTCDAVRRQSLRPLRP